MRLDTLTPEDAFRLLCLQAEWGADEAIEPDPLDRLRPTTPHPEASRREESRRGAPRPATPLRPAPPSAAAPAPPAPAIAPLATPLGTPAERAQKAAAGANTLEELRAAIAAFDGCALRDTASNLVFAEGDPAAALLLIGETPGRDEDRSGHPFAGAEGLLLDQMLASIGLTRAGLMLTHLIPWRPPGGRPASPSELALCLPFLHRLIALLQPARAVLLGGTVARALLSPQGGLGRSQGGSLGSVRRRGPRDWTRMTVPGLPAPLPALPLPSLGDLIRTPPLKRDAWAGLRLLRRTLESDRTEA